MFHIKEIGIGVVAASAIVGGSLTIVSESKKSKLNAYVTAINLNKLPGYFICVDEYDPLTYHIDETIFNQEFKSYMMSQRKKVKYSYKIVGNDVKVKYRYKGKTKTKTYHLQENS